MSDDFNKDIQIHIHEHVGPIRERVGRLEGRLDVNEREITMLRVGLEEVRSLIGATKDAILDKFSTHEDGEWERYSSLESNVKALKNWLIGISAGAAVIWAIVLFMFNSGMFVLHHTG